MPVYRCIKRGTEFVGGGPEFAIEVAEEHLGVRVGHGECCADVTRGTQLLNGQFSGALGASTCSRFGSSCGLRFGQLGGAVPARNTELVRQKTLKLAAPAQSAPRGEAALPELYDGQECPSHPALYENLISLTPRNPKSRQAVSIVPALRNPFHRHLRRRTEESDGRPGAVPYQASPSDWRWSRK